MTKTAIPCVSNIGTPEPCVKRPGGTSEKWNQYIRITGAHLQDRHINACRGIMSCESVGLNTKETRCTQVLCDLCKPGHNGDKAFKCRLHIVILLQAEIRKALNIFCYIIGIAALADIFSLDTLPVNIVAWKLAGILASGFSKKLTEIIFSGIAFHLCDGFSC